MSRYEAIVIGVSSGGLNALKTLLPALPQDFKWPVIIVQHLGSNSDGYWINMLNEQSALRVKEADEKEPILPGHVYIAPANYHLLIESDYSFSLSVEQRVNFARPSVDVLFESATRVYQNRLVGIVLTGANNDGAAGLRNIGENGGLTIVQDPATAEATQMPSAAIDAFPVHHILPLKEIVKLLIQLNQL